MDRRRFWCGLAAVAAALTLVPSTAQAAHSPNLPAGGVNTHLTYFGTPYGDAELVAKAAKTAEAKLLRDNVAPYQNQGWYDRVYSAFRRVNAVSGARFMLIAVRADQSAADQVNAMAPLVNSGIVSAIEGANEWDNKNGHVAGWEVQLRTHQCELYRQVKARWPNMTVVGPSLSYKVGSYVGDLSHCMDMGNFHYYARSSGIDTRDLNRRWADNAVVSGWGDGSGDPIVVTEANGILGDGFGGTEATQAQGMKDLYRVLGALPYGGAHRVVAYEMLQPGRPNRPATDWQNNFGIYKSCPQGWCGKPVFFPVRDANRRG